MVTGVQTHLFASVGHRPQRASSGDTYRPGSSGLDDALLQAQRYIAARDAERNQRAAMVDEMKTLSGPRLLERGAEILRQIPHSEEPRMRHAAATAFFQKMLEEPERVPIASLVLAVLGDVDQIPKTEHMCIAEQSREQANPVVCAGAPVDRALSALEGQVGDADLVQLGLEMVAGIPQERDSMQQGFASIRALANLVGRFDPEGELEASRGVVDFLTTPLGNWDFSRQTEGGNHVITQLARHSLSQMREVLALRQLANASGGSLGETQSHVAVGGVMLRKRRP